MRGRRGSILLALTLLTLVAASCGGSEDDGNAAAASVSSDVAVFAAASLTESFPRIDPDARYSFAGSDELATQIRQGAPADVYAAANARYPEALHEEGLLEEPETFATNRLVLIVPRANPAGIESYEDVARPGVKLVVAAEGVPVGQYTREVLATLDLEGALENVVSHEVDVKGVVAKVALGEADAGFVYATDAAAAREDVTVIELPEGSQPPIEYKIAVASETDAQQAAQAFVDRVLSDEGQAVLREAGFGPPASP